MKEIVTLILFGALLIACSGCVSTITHYDENGKIVKIEKATNFSRVMDGTNEKSQIVLFDGTLVDFEVSATAGDNCTPGISTKYASGKNATINIRDGAKLQNTDKVIKEFFAGSTEISAAGVKTTK